MFGSEFYKHPESLIDSFKEMNEDYAKVKKSSDFLALLQKIYLYFWGIPEIGFQLRGSHFRKIIISNIKKNKVENILDAGSGIGAYTFWLRKYFDKAKVAGWEVDEKKISFTKKFAKEIGSEDIIFELKDLTKIKDEKEKYDLIVNIDVLEHIKDYSKVIKNFYRLLSSGGYLYIHTPQVNQKRIFKYLESWYHGDHVREGFSPKILEEELRSSGFRIVGQNETFGFWGKLSWEINHMLFSRGFILAGILYPLLYLVSILDLFTKNKKGLGIAILARKI